MSEHKYIDLTGLTTYDQLIKPYIDSSISDHIRADTTAAWNSDLTYIPNRGQMIIYTDAYTVDNEPYPGFKVGDGLAYLADLPFQDDDLRSILEDHLNNAIIHITNSERATWNNKVSASYGNETLILDTST